MRYNVIVVWLRLSCCPADSMSQLFQLRETWESWKRWWIHKREKESSHILAQIRSSVSMCEFVLWELDSSESKRNNYLIVLEDDRTVASWYRKKHQSINIVSWGEINFQRLSHSNGRKVSARNRLRAPFLSQFYHPKRLCRAEREALLKSIAASTRSMATKISASSLRPTWKIDLTESLQFWIRNIPAWQSNTNEFQAFYWSG